MATQEMVSREKVLGMLLGYLEQGRYKEALGYINAMGRAIFGDNILLARSSGLMVWGSEKNRGLFHSTEHRHKSFRRIAEGQEPEIEPDKATKELFVAAKTTAGAAARLARHKDEKAKKAAFEASGMCLAGKDASEIGNYVKKQGYGNVWDEENAKARKEADSLIEKSKPVADGPEKTLLTQVRIERAQEDTKSVADKGTELAYDSTEDYVEKNA